MIQKLSPRRNQILELMIEHKDGLSIDDIGAALDISRTAVMQHVVSIENDGYVKRTLLNKSAGRPVNIYTITEKGINCFPKQYAWFSNLVLSSLSEEMGPERFKSYMQKLGTTLAEKIRTRFENQGVDKRFEELIKIMTDLGYQVESDHNLLIRAHNCVYHDLALEHNELCDFDVALISGLLNQEVSQITCMAKGDCACNFQIRKDHS